MDKWEYKKITHYVDQKEMNVLGSEGWELLWIDKEPSSYSNNYEYIFKRKKQCDGKISK